MAPLDPFLPHTARPLTVSGMSITSRLCKAVLEALRMMGVNLLRNKPRTFSASEIDKLVKSRSKIRNAPGVEVTAKHGWKKIAALAKLKGERSVKVGVLRGTGDHPNAKPGIIIALVAWWNEFGTRKIPARPFLRTTLREHGYYREHLKRATQAAVIKTVKFEGGIDVPLKAVGVLAASDIRKKITTGPWIPNSEFTIAMKSNASGDDLTAFFSARDADPGIFGKVAKNRALQRKHGIKAQPLIDTGIMRQSIRSALSDEHA